MGKATAYVKIRSVGQCYACEATVTINGAIVHTTRVYPHGSRGVAYGSAESWARERGHDTRDEGDRLHALALSCIEQLVAANRELAARLDEAEGRRAKNPRQPRLRRVI